VRHELGKDECPDFRRRDWTRNPVIETAAVTVAIPIAISVPVPTRTALIGRPRRACGIHIELDGRVAPTAEVVVSGGVGYQTTVEATRRSALRLDVDRPVEKL